VTTTSRHEDLTLLGIVTVTIPCVKISGKALAQVDRKKYFFSLFSWVCRPVPKSSVPDQTESGEVRGLLRMLLRPVGTE